MTMTRVQTSDPIGSIDNKRPALIAPLFLQYVNNARTARHHNTVENEKLETGKLHTVLEIFVIVVAIVVIKQHKR